MGPEAPRSLRRAALVSIAFASRVTPLTAGNVRCDGYDRQWGTCPDLPECDGCVAINCEFGDWQPWFDAGGCAQLEFRKRQIVKENNECGLPCNGSKTESRRNVSPECESAGKNCWLSQWTLWSDGMSGETQCYRTRHQIHNQLFKDCDSGYDEAKLNDFDAGLPAFQLAGWQFMSDEGEPWTPGTQYRPDLNSFGFEPGVIAYPAGTSYWGWDFPGNGFIKLHFKGAGAFHLDFGNAWNDGEAVATLKNADKKELKRYVAGAHTPSMKVNFLYEDTDYLRLAEEHPRGILVINSIKFYCPSDKSTASLAVDDNCPKPAADLNLHSVETSKGAGGLAIQELLYSKVGTVNGKEVDLLITAAEDEIIYVNNGKVTEGGLASINCKQNLKSSFLGRFYETGSKNPVVIPQLAVTFYDFDSAKDGPEVVHVNGLHSYELGAGSEHYYEVEEHSEETVTATSIQHGNVSDNPDSAEDLTPAQRGRSMTVLFKEREAFMFTFDLTGIPSKGGRNIEFSLKQAITSSTCEVKEALNGEACEGNVKETHACVGRNTTNCELSEWHEWTGCSSTCGAGERKRMRRVTQQAVYPGSACEGETEQSATCNMAPCEQQDCVLAQWEAWSACEKSTLQQYRTRKETQKVIGLGIPCNGNTKETKSCPSPTAVDCLLSQWALWTQCDKSCDGGQQTRKRTVTPAANGGKCEPATLSETAPCMTAPCNLGSINCVLGQWVAWGACDVDCGQGVSERTRAVATPAGPGAKGCDGSLKEVAGCSGTACGDNNDCQWGQWHEWSGCTCTCEGGTRTRNRGIQQQAMNGGKACDPLVKSEMGNCNTQSCSDEDCVDATWGEWQDWSSCSATCSDAYMSRSRSVGQEPNSCGKPLTGLREEFQKCDTLPDCEPSQPCIIGEWSAWSDCSCSCYGAQERNRVIAQFARGDGEPCESEALQEIAPCNPAVNVTPSEGCGVHVPVDCLLSQWTPWTVCTRTCGGGQRKSVRKVETYPSNGGKPCDDAGNQTAALAKLEACGEQDCTDNACLDCLWAPWDDWSDCSHCGSAMYRQRHIERMPNRCGEPCHLDGAKEVSNCTSHCGTPTVTCAFTDWSAATACPDASQPGSCGATSMKSRSMGFVSTAVDPNSSDFLFIAPEDSLCSGSQVDLVACMATCVPDCVPADCAFQPWADWLEPNCQGLCHRQRGVLSPANECGKQCSGALEETKRCEAKCEKIVDCELSEWSVWTNCEGADAQSARTREVSTYPVNGGKGCSGALAETKACSAPKKSPCTYTAWGTWTKCNKVCGGGVHTMTRKVLLNAESGGELCDGSLEELEPCNVQACDSESTPCSFAAWADWSGCAADYQKIRSRDIATAATGGGTSCEGTMEETVPCGQSKVDCEMSQWTVWESCDRTCGGGQQSRQRQVNLHARNGGMACPNETVQAQGCSEIACNGEVCTFSPWVDWSTCSASCGSGQTQRERRVLGNPQEFTTPCSGTLSETKACADEFAQPDCLGNKDCIWDDWTGWSDCSCSCGGGQKTRARKINQMPSPSGAACAPHNRDEIVPCNTQDCYNDKEIDGAWSEWSDWSFCSASCQTGVTFRLRHIGRMAQFGGKEPQGTDRESKFCNEGVQCDANIDCEFGDWDEWSDCSLSCTGVKRRMRRIKKFGRGYGEFCFGSLKEVFPCNGKDAAGTEEGTAVGGDLKFSGCDSKEPPQDCVMTQWTAWAVCSASCGGGQKERSREIKSAPLYGGKACGQGLKETNACAQSACAGPTPIDCTFGEWDDWHACSKCGGVTKRYRSITTFPKFGGHNCEAFDSSEVSNCTSPCEKPDGYCAWTGWTGWGECSVSCGTGKRLRTRTLKLSETKPSLRVVLPDGSIHNASDIYAGDKVLSPEEENNYIEQKYLELSARAQDLEARGKQDVLSAFCLGSFVSAAMFLGFRLSARLRIQATDEVDETEMALMD